MIVALCFLALSFFPQAGSAAAAEGDWAMQRTYHFLDEAGNVDITNVERTVYRVDLLEAKAMTVEATRTPVSTKSGADAAHPPVDAKARVLHLKFGVGGAPGNEEDLDDPLAARVDRMQWTALEDRRGVSWSRRFPAAVGIPAGKVTVRPTERNARSETLAISYTEEGSDLRGEATCLRLLPSRIPASLKLTLTNVHLPGQTIPLKLSMNQDLVKPDKYSEMLDQL